MQSKDVEKQEVEIELPENSQHDITAKPYENPKNTITK